MDIKELHREGHSIRSIARMTGHSRNTVKKVLEGEHSLERKPRSASSKLDEYKPYLTQRFQEHGLSAVRLHDEIREMGYQGSVDVVRRFVRTLKGETVRKRKLTVRFETPPGKQGQADWAYCGKHEDASGKAIAVYVFVMVLGYSRQMFIHFTTSMRMPELIRCHQLAFEFFGGWPAEMLYDNMKQVRVSRSQWNEPFLDFANHYGFTPKTHRPYRPRTKGKVERAVDYVKDNFLRGRSFHGLGELNAQALHWLENTANVRVHATTKERPCDLIAKETLTPLASAPVYNYIDPVKRTVGWESMVRFQGSRYSVPPAFAGQTVEVSAVGGQIVVRTGDMVIAEHPRAARPGQCIADKEHLAELWRIVEEETREPNRKPWRLSFDERVETASLTSFEELCP